MPTPGDQPGPGNFRGNSNALRVLGLKLELKKNSSSEQSPADLTGVAPEQPTASTHDSVIAEGGASVKKRPPEAATSQKPSCFMACRSLKLARTEIVLNAFANWRAHTIAS